MTGGGEARPQPNRSFRRGLAEVLGSGGPPPGWLADLSSRILPWLMSELGAEAPRETEPGERIGVYELETVLGRGGTGVVFGAYDTRLDRRVALKFLSGPAWHAAARERLLDEARAAARLDHPGVAAIHEVGETDDGRSFIVMPRYDGGTLAARLEEGALSVEEAVDVACQVADALAAAHRAGVIHRDVKPSNIMLTRHGVRVVDFGIAVPADADPAVYPAGTAPYMSPEQAEGRAVDARTDVWSLGVTLYEMLAGRPPFTGDDRTSLFRDIRENEALPLATLRADAPAELTRAVERCLQKSPAARFPSADALLDALTQLIPASSAGRNADGTGGSGAEDEYRKGRHFLDRGDPVSAGRARDHFVAALNDDPTFARAWCGLSDAYETLAYVAALPPEEAHLRARAAAERALSLDPDLAEAHTSLATVLVDYYHDWKGAEQHYRLALELNPGYATNHQLFAELLRDRGHFEEALLRIEEAIRLDPLSTYFRLIRGVILHMARRHEDAMAAFTKLLQATPDYPMAHFFIGLTCASAGRTDEALAALRAGDPEETLPDAICVRGAALAWAGRSEEARQALESLQRLPPDRHRLPFHEALIRLGLGEIDRGVALLEEDVERRTWFARILGVEPLVDPARGHPRFEALLDRVGLGDVGPPGGSVTPDGQG